MDVRVISINDIGLSVRSSNALHRAGVDTVGQMLGHTWESLSEIRNLGKKSIDEILLKIEEYKAYDSEGGLPEQEESSAADLPDMPEDFNAWMQTDEGRAFILSWLEEEDIKTGSMELLSARAYNHLLLNGYTGMHQIAFTTADDLMQIPRMDPQCAEEIAGRCRNFLEEKKDDILASLKAKHEAAEKNKDELLRNMLHSEANHDRILQFVRANDAETDTLDLPVRAKNALKRQGHFKISDFIFLTKKELWDFPQMGTKTAEEILAFIDAYMAKNEVRIKAALSGDDSVLWDDAVVDGIINEAFNRIGFGGYSLQELREKAEISDQISDEQLKRILGSMIAEGRLEYVDFRCYRIYPKFEEYLIAFPDIEERTKQIISRKLAGDTLEGIAAGYDLTRERVRQIISRDIRNVKNIYQAKTGLEWFDEDYYRYFFETYAFDRKDAEEWLGISREIFNYLELTGSKRGTGNLEEAPDDYHNLDLGFRLKIKNYLNRNKLFFDGKWIEKKRADLEEYVIRKYCRENVTFTEFTQIYNDFLREEELDSDADLYYTEGLDRAVKRRLSEARFLLWKYGEQIRCYDIESHDYTELWETLNLDAYEDIEYSTSKFMTDHPGIMEKYDIRDQYELHNLLRKTLPEGSFHDFHCNRTPMVEFGKFDRDGALLDLLIDHAPISQADFAEVVHQEYGYDPATVQGTYLQALDAYYHQGMYTIDQKAMTTGHKEALEEALTDDFYYIDEIRKKYASVAPDADPEEINPYNLKTMGFFVLSRYVYRNHTSLDDYFRDLLTCDDILDISPYRQRFAYVQSFSMAFVNLKNEMEIFEFEPNQIITFRKLASAGITKDDLHAFCDEVYDFTENGRYFSVQSIKKAGFESELFDLGFSDWFYASLLTSDERFSYSKAFLNIILYQGSERITVATFEEALIREQGSMDVYDLMTEMEETYGCRISDRLDLIYKVDGTDIYYDKYLDRLYANTGVFNRELDETEGL